MISWNSSRDKIAYNLTGNFCARILLGGFVDAFDGGVETAASAVMGEEDLQSSLPPLAAADSVTASISCSERLPKSRYL